MNQGVRMQEGKAGESAPATARNAAESAFAAQYRRYLQGTGRFPASRGLSRDRMRALQRSVDEELRAAADRDHPAAVALARELGAAAFHRGAKRVPALDPRLREVAPLNVQTLDAWLRAWDHENLNSDGPRNAASEA